jgi:hypothetical protein
MASKGKHEGIQVRHTRRCPTTSGEERCTCKPTYRAEVFDAREGQLLKKSFASLADAKAWRQDAQGELRKGTLSAARSPRLGEASAAWLDGARAGAIRSDMQALSTGCSFRGMTLRRSATP